MRRRYDSMTALPNDCVHYWLCGDMDQTTIHAVCKNCDAKADFDQGQYPWSHGVLPRQLYVPTLHWTRSGNEVSPYSIVEADY